MQHFTIHKPEGPLRGRIALPRSKSVANRALVLAAMAGDLRCVGESGKAADTVILRRLLEERPDTLHCGLGGTTLRFLLAWACAQEGEEHLVTGDAPLLQRPHDALIDALVQLGADIQKTTQGFHVRGKRLRGGSITFYSPASSQYLSALMLIAPRMAQGLRIAWNGTQLSRPYVKMTARAMRHFGAEVQLDPRMIAIPPGTYNAKPFSVPRDWSAASFWFELVALAEDAEVELTGLIADGWQGDEAITSHVQPWVEATATKQGVLLRNRRHPDRLPTRVDLAATPDLFQPLAFTHAATGAETTFTGLHNLSLKETDRLAAVAEALAALGVPVERTSSSFRIMPPSGGIKLPPNAPVFAVHGDHRMAMALAPMALRCGAITIDDAQVVEKSYPGFWADLRSVGFGVL